MALKKWVFGTRLSQQITEQNANLDELERRIAEIEKKTSRQTLANTVDLNTISTGYYELGAPGVYPNGLEGGNMYGTLFATMDTQRKIQIFVSEWNKTYTRTCFKTWTPWVLVQTTTV